MNSNKKVFFSGYSELAGRSGDLYVKRNNGCWHINAGVDASGHDTGFGVVFDVVDNTPESNIYDEFFRQTARVQQFIINELGATQQSCNNIFKEIWNYIQQETIVLITSPKSPVA